MDSRYYLRLPDGLMENSIQVKTPSSPSHSVSKINSAAVSNDGPTRVSLFPFPLHHKTAGDNANISCTACARFGPGKE